MEIKTKKAIQADVAFDKASYVEFEPEQSNDTTGSVPNRRDPVHVRVFHNNAMKALADLRNDAYKVTNL